jgi:hypothetical protein
VTIRLSVRVAGFAILAVQVAASMPYIRRPSGMAALAIIVAAQVAALVRSTRAGSMEAVKVMAPAVLTGVTAAAAWTASVFVAPSLASNDTLALLAIVGAGTAVAFRPPSGAGRRLEVVLVASVTTALLTFLAISSLLPAFDGFVSNWHPPTYTDVTRLVDPILEFAIFAVLTIVLSADLLWVRARRRRTPAGEPGVPYEAAPNEMVVLPPNSGPA